MILTHGCRILLLLILLVTTRQIKANCNEKLGIEDGRIPERHIKVSSRWDLARCDAQHSRLNDPVGGNAWCALTATTDEWIQVDLRESKQVTGIMIQGRSNNNQWVTKFKVLHSDDGATWKHIGTGDDREDKVFIGNTDRHTVVTAMFPNSITATYIRINPVEWNSHPSLRFEVLGCKATCRNRQYTRIENKRLQNHEIQIKPSRNYLICERACSSDTSCKSFNWNQSTRSCQTNDATSGAHHTDYVDSSNWVYHQVDETIDDIKCDSSLCPAGKICRNQCTMSGMKTICSAACPVDWQTFQGHCYRFMSSKKDWTSADTDCRNQDAHLTSIQSAEEDSFVDSLLGGTYSWIGFKLDGTWKWSDGTVVSFTDWGSWGAIQQPDNSGACTKIGWSKSDTQWDDLDCTSSLAYICEISKP